MKGLSRILSGAVMLMTGLTATAQTCELGIGYAPITDGEKVDAAVNRALEAKLRTALTAQGVAAGDYDCQFFLTGRFDHEFSQEAAGPGGKVAVKTNLQLAILDGENRKVYATATFPLKGVGSTDQQALKRALASLKTNNPEFASFVENGKQKIINYFNANYNTYLTKAQRAMQNRNYDEALFWATSIPECCNGFSQASTLIHKIMGDRTNYNDAQLLAQAEAEWAANPTAAGAEAAYSYISQMDPSSSSYAAAKALGAKMSKSVKADYDFETKEKYRNAVDLEKRRIAAARDVAVAYAKNQPKTIVKVHHHWRWW